MKTATAWYLGYQIKTAGARSEALQAAGRALSKATKTKGALGGTGLAGKGPVRSLDELEKAMKARGGSPVYQRLKAIEKGMKVTAPQKGRPPIRKSAG